MNYIDPMDRPVRDPTSWEIRRARDNAIGETAIALLREEGKTTYSRDEFLDAMERAQEKAGVRYRDDAAARPWDGER